MMNDLDRYNELRWDEIQDMEFEEKLEMISADLNNPETIIGYALNHAIKNCDVPEDSDVIDKLDYLTQEQFKELKESIDDYIYSFKKIKLN